MRAPPQLVGNLMTEWHPLLLAVLALLATPGPTNTLVAAAGAGCGGRLAALGAHLQQAHRCGIPDLVCGEALACGGDRKPPQQRRTVGRVFATTLLNPKTLVLAFGIFPAVGFAGRLPYLAAFGGLVVVTAVGWIAFGALLRRSSKGRLTLRAVDRVAAVVLLVFAGLIAASALR